MPEIPADTTQSPSRPARRVALWMLGLVPLSMAAGILVGRWLASSDGRLDAFRQLTPVEVVVGFPLTLWAVLFVHEAGHLVAARSQGWRFLLLLVGPLRVVSGATGLVWGFNRAWATWGGLTASIPPVDETFRREMLVTVLAGPFASAVLGVCGLVLAGHGGPLTAHASVAGMTSLLIAGATLLPVKTGGYQSDGAQALELIRNPEAARHRARRLSVLLRGLAGIRPRDVDATEVRGSLAETVEPRERLALWSLLMHNALDRGALDEAADAASEVAALHHAYPDGMRQMVALDLAWYFGRYGRDAAEARRWLDLSRGGFVDPFQRPLAEAALAWAERRGDDARRAAGLARRLLPRAMDRGTALAIADQLAALEEEIAAPPRLGSD